MTTKLAKSSKQVENMRSLSANSAAWLLGFRHVRNLRDQAGLPTNSDGTFNASELLKWARGSRVVTDVELPAEETIDELLQFSQAITCDRGAQRFLDILDEQVAEHGEAGYLAVFRVLVSEIRQWFEWWPEDGRHPTEAEIRQRHEESVQRQLDEIRNDPGPLRVVSTCDCGSVRRGGRWSKKNKVPSGWRTLGSVCENCHANKNGEQAA